jgi:branched-chain amino acid transport system ATP-binding protein
MLECIDVGVRYGALPAVRGVTLTVPVGGIVAVLGSNGAGKSSLLRAISGQVRPIEGEIRFDGASIASLPPHAIVARGIAHVPEGRMLLGDLSVRENLLLGAHNAGSLARAAERLDAALDGFPVLKPRLDGPAGALSGGEAQMLALAGLPRRGIAVLLVEQNVRRALAISGYACLMQNGAVLRRGPAAALLQDPAVQDAYLGDGGGME